VPEDMYLAPPSSPSKRNPAPVPLPKGTEFG
jgi:hypothetical protein